MITSEGSTARLNADASQQLDWFQQMLAIRLFEEKVHELYLQGLVPGTTHLCQGQEAVSVGAVAAMAPDDFLTITYRGHGQALARGVDRERAFAEIMGRQAGVCRGFGGSMHLTDVSRGLLGSFAIVGAGLPVAVGAAMSAQLQGQPRVALTFFGDGATNIGTFHEALNMASVWRAPVVFVCENNLYGEFSPVRHTTPMDDLAERASAYAMPAEIVDGQDVALVFERTAAAVARARAGRGPTLLEMKTYRYRGHSRSDPARYRPPGELEAWRERDPIDLLARRLEDAGLLSAAEQQDLHGDLQRVIDAAAARAASAAWPDPQEDISAYVYAS